MNLSYLLIRMKEDIQTCVESFEKETFQNELNAINNISKSMIRVSFTSIFP